VKKKEAAGVARAAIGLALLHLESKESDALRALQLDEVLADAVAGKRDRLTLIAGDLNLNA
jgi:hypothetical protein